MRKGRRTEGKEEKNYRRYRKSGPHRRYRKNGPPELRVCCPSWIVNGDQTVWYEDGKQQSKEKKGNKNSSFSIPVKTHVSFVERKMQMTMKDEGWQEQIEQREGLKMTWPYFKLPL